MKPEIIEAATRAVHEANRAWCIAHGDYSQPAWEDMSEEMRDSSVNGIVAVIHGAGPRESHEAWMSGKLARGWTWGTHKDEVAKTHPDLLPYDELSAYSRAKDRIFVAVASAFVEAAKLV